jgi:hypothetical protein
MADLLSAYDETSWADALRRLALDIDTDIDIDELRRRVRSLYGGAGSLNDIVLHATDLDKMRRDNNEFDELRNILYEAANDRRC